MHARILLSAVVIALTLGFNLLWYLRLQHIDVAVMESVREERNIVRAECQQKLDEKTCFWIDFQANFAETAIISARQMAREAFAWNSGMLMLAVLGVLWWRGRGAQ